jgi:hypothetical protein
MVNNFPWISVEGNPPNKFEIYVVRRTFHNTHTHARAQWLGEYWWNMTMERKLNDVVAYMAWDDWKVWAAKEVKKMDAQKIG